MKLISADDVIKAVDKHTFETKDGLCLDDDISVILENVPTIEDRKWISCSERLPEDDTLMLVNYIDNRPDAMDIWIGWYEMENVWYIDGEPHSREFGNEVIAWMPLPEPYREEGD